MPKVLIHCYLEVAIDQKINVEIIVVIYKNKHLNSIMVKNK